MALSKRTLSAASLAATVSLFAIMAASAQETTKAESVELDTITVQGNGASADDAVKGYVATASRAGTKTDTPLSKTPQSVEVVTKDQVEDQGANTVAEAVGYSANVFGNYRGGKAVLDEISVRGFTFVPNYLDGLQYSNSRLGAIDPYFLERVEVLKGPASVLYGQASPGGIVNMVSKRADGTTGGEVELTTGDDKRAGVAFDVSGKIDKAGVWSYRLVGKASRAESSVEDINEKGGAIMPSLRWAPNDDTSLTLDALYSHEPEAGYKNFRAALGTLYATQYGFVPSDFNASDPDYDKSVVTQAHVGYEFKHRFNDTFTFRQNVAYNNVDTSFRALVWKSTAADGKTLNRYNSERDNDVYQAEIDNQLVSKFSAAGFDHTLLTGTDYKWTRQKAVFLFGTASSIDWVNPVYGNYSAAWTATRQRAISTVNQLGAYVQDQASYGNLTLSLGGRVDRAETEAENLLTDTTTKAEDLAFTWRAGAIYNFDNGIAPYVSYSTSFEPNTDTDVDGQVLDPTTAQQWEAGVRYAPGNGRFQVTASVFQITQQDVAEEDPTSSYYESTGEIRSRGFEAEARAAVTDNLSIIASYGYVDAKITEDNDASQIGLRQSMLPRQNASLWGKYAFTDGVLNGLGLGLGVRYIGDSTDSTNTLKVKSQTLLDAMASYDFGALSEKFQDVSLQVNGTNLMDRRYVASCASSAKCWAGEGRTVLAKLKYSW